MLVLIVIPPILTDMITVHDRDFNVLSANKAAKELKTRIIQRVGDFGKMTIAGTFHSICAGILRKYAERIGYTSNFVIYDSADTYKVIKDTIKAMNLDSTGFPYKKIANMISNFKNKLIVPKKLSRIMNFTVIFFKNQK